MKNCIPSNVDKRTKLYKELERYQEYLYERNLAENTITSYIGAVRQYYRQYRKITPQNLQMHRFMLIDKYAPGTANLRIRAMSQYLKFLDIEDVVLPLIKVQRRMQLENVISQADYEYLKRRLWEDEKFNYYFAVRCMAATGVRVSELVQFRVEDIARGFKDIHSKGDKVRRIYIPKALRIAMDEWLEGEGRDHGRLFLNNLGDPMSESAIRCQLKAFSGQYQLAPECMYPHSFRHRFAISFIEQCGDISLLANLLGHENLETTRIYLRRSSTEQYRIVNKVVNW